ncbi:MAG: topoisomerase protein [Candidatus Falkowbacteria bacterium GW2011_GWC2_38_22]|uniref:DNA topoisomerase 1 n=1 Tax=Candidatus Falkowbacteria bacterium GW2011_GWE1_38_31 TaxID=1618638 RepID=A0A0G0MBV2_9BACT|nr:MAG: topoisomerase protein [Candidatus Falkowbacteria bacterium GW2011_GWF2_38_1205]KKQ61805.1 MAG: topoisomerase protein [Candidatus Falkowbacteria bacterium GW2011_GWC2_38_22]KKQ64113.1 MAG: topoisomerase protein [Candidatus Falkowbacteria bacterium GW2011_GWF1_38_22]KKQ66537.1 MAG: topoisomerase protein [Candidatus Falkowbacteria bacterium GW2011_GWE2_38_254]KKQ71219.1 MAG: topoisomerase protein [Candidatus Falkowbacteria bacterium GW2011_GWE1_38_31]KKQ73347.1 MAG: topoisomerase protein 
MNLIIVESPTKAKTITRFLGKKFKVESSFGHVRDLPKSTMGVDMENDFLPKYVIPATAKKNLNKLKELAKKADQVILATDEDREGEAIAWHLAEALKLDKEGTGRIVFHEITKSAIEEALKTPRHLNMDLVNAQQARRVLDRLVGYELSPFLWKKVARGLSAGRVQSVAVRLIVEREREIQAFKPEEYWSLEADLSPKNDKEKIFKAHLHKLDGKTLDKFYINNQEKAEETFAELKDAEYIVTQIEKKQSKKNPPSPFTTSTLQQAANRMLGFSAKQTMMIAQQLYEGLDLGGDSGGLITYMRTDSLNLSDKFLNETKEYLTNNFGAKYALESARRFKTKSKGAQEAHEAVRPTEVGRDPEFLKDKLNNNQYRLYKLIWQRAVASQMSEALIDSTTIDIDASDTKYQFRSSGQIIAFDGYLKVYPEQSKELELPDVKQNEALKLHKLEKEQHFTKPPARYSDAGIVKVMEKHGIGRPSTYAPTLATIIARNYVNRDEAKKLYPTDIAFVVNDLLTEHFKDIVDFEFTAKMEEDLDKIADGEIKWQPLIKDFYTPFHAQLEEKYKSLKKEDIMPEEKSNEICDKCGAAMIIKTGRYGKFYACSAFPDCKNIKGLTQNASHESSPEKTEQLKVLEDKYKNEVCDKCGSAMAIKNGRFGPFLACTGYPKCKNIKSIKENSGSTGIKCPVCGKGDIVQKRSKRGAFYACDQYPDCKTAFFAKPTGEKCPDCGALLIEAKDGVKCSAKGCGYTK